MVLTSVAGKIYIKKRKGDKHFYISYLINLFFLSNYS